MKIRQMIPAFYMVGLALAFSIGSAVDTVMFALRTNYGFNVGLVRGPWFVVGLIFESTVAILLWIVAIEIVTERHHR